MIINIRGTSGSGKSTIVYTLLNQYRAEKDTDERGKVIGYLVKTDLPRAIYVVGRYETACGGLDTVPTQQQAADMALAAHSVGHHVIMEGLLASAAGPKGALTAALIETKSAVFGILDTPEQVCLDRVRARRAARGDERPFNETNTRAKYKQTMQTAKAMYDAGYDVRAIDHTRAYEHVMEILKEADDQQ